jgi:predicted MFS family arabinose efflux permease
MPVKLALGGAFALAAAMGIGRFVYTPILPFMADGVPLSASDAGLVASANFLGYLIGALAGSMGGLPGSQRTWFLSALAVSGLTTAAMGLADSIALFLVLRFSGGLASAFVLVFSSALVLERLAGSGRPGLSALHFAGVGAGIAFSAILIAWLGYLDASWPQLWFASGLATLLLLLIIWALVSSSGPEAKTGAGPVPDSSPETLGLTSGLVRLILAYGLFGFGYVITATFISVIVRDAPELRSAEPYVWLAVGLSAAPSIYVWNRISGRVGPRAAFASACLIEAAGVALSVLATGPLLVLLAAVLLGGTFMGITALGLIEARHQTRGDPRRILAIMTASFGTGQMIGPWLAGSLHTMTGSFQAASFAAAAALLAAAVLVALTRDPGVTEVPLKPKPSDWETLRAELIAEGKTELVEAVEALRAKRNEEDALKDLKRTGLLDN